MRFVDLFAGLGGFHVALRELGHECVFACEVDRGLRDLYETNFGLAPAGDIRLLQPSDVPEHDILCAGFPCQPFSKAGSQQGFDDPRYGDLFEFVLDIIKAREPRYVLLENVPNLGRHRSGLTWQKIERDLKSSEYDVDARLLSPHEYGIPQIRQRIFIVARPLPRGLGDFTWPARNAPDTPLSIRTVLDPCPRGARPLSERVTRCLHVWQEFLDRFPKDEELPSFPIWTMEFGATYPYETATPYAVGEEALRTFRGAHGRALAKLPASDLFDALPSYARTATGTFPHWKVQYISQNRSFYSKHRRWLDEWLPSIREFPPSFQKLEWNCKGMPRNIWDYILQFRPSGVRVKRPTTAPSLVAMTASQVPIIAWERRYLTPGEGARLQSLGDDLILPKTSSKAFEALGNAVNAALARLIAQHLVSEQASGCPLQDAS